MEKAGIIAIIAALAACEAAPPAMTDGQKPSVIDAGTTQPDAGSTDPTPTEAGSDADAAAVDATPVPKTGNDAACDAALGWWATDASFDSTITPSGFASELNPLLSGENPFTIADYVDSSMTWTMRATGTRTNGSYQQYFPVAYPSDTAAMTRSSLGFSSASIGSSWLVVIDSSSTEVWIALANEIVSATYGDTYCQSLSGGVLDATIPASASSTAITTSQGSTTLGALLGATTATSPVGWSVHLTFDGQKVDVSNK